LDFIVKGKKVYMNDNYEAEFKEYIKYPPKFRVDTYMFNKIHTVLYNNGKGGIRDSYNENVLIIINCTCI
jgi:hypothetical protein